MKLHEIDNKYGSLIFKPYKEAKKILENHGYKVISQPHAKEEYLKIVPDKETAKKVSDCECVGQTNEAQPIYDQLEKIVMKENRSGSMSWETLNSYMRYRSGCFYKWFDN
jgi:hypothetical protein